MHSLMNVKHFVIGVGRALVFKTELNLPDLTMTNITQNQQWFYLWKIRINRCLFDRICFDTPYSNV